MRLLFLSFIVCSGIFLSACNDDKDSSTSTVTPPTEPTSPVKPQPPACKIHCAP
ncbi:hypothetical protein [Acinetobacter stercoris]|uniref:hypothetical protein n=1 Tax=Acinetobacter stercoris TaxID=2126983 RepID=UPI00148C9549|nr:MULTISPECIES: hypothetical protein [Acinetobacter]